MNKINMDINDQCFNDEEDLEKPIKNNQPL